MPYVLTPPPLAPAVNPNAVILPAPDMDRAITDAKKVLASIDFSRETIVVWLPGTGRHGVPSPFGDAAKRVWGNTATVVALEYPAGNEVRKSTATGIQTLKLVLAGIAAHTGQHHKIHLAGESQGAWVITEAVKDPMMRSMVSRMALLGHPYVASTHYDDGHDANVMVINRRVDIVARPVRGNINNAIESVESIFARKISLHGIKTLLGVAKDNPQSAYYLAVTGMRLITPHGPDRDPHNYEDMMIAAVQFLHV